MAKNSVETRFSDTGIPYYYQIANLLRRKIEQGELAPGSKLPRELELAEIFGVSRIPIRQALSLLASDGLLDRQRGRGTFVSKTFEKPKVLNLKGIIEEYVSHGMEGEHHLLSVQDIPVTLKLGEFFGLPVGEKVMRIQRYRAVENVPFCYVQNYVPVEIGEMIPHSEYNKRTLLNILEQRLHIPVAQIRQTIEARTADNEVASYLSIGIMSPVMYVETFLRGEDAKPLEFSQIYYRGDRLIYSVERLRNGNTGEILTSS